MNFADITFDANEQLLLKNLRPIDEEFYNEMDKSFWDASHAHLSFVEWKEVLASSGYEVNRIRRNVNMRTMRQFFYEGEYITVEIGTLDPSWLTNEFSLGALGVDNLAKQNFEEKNYAMYFFAEQNLFAIDYFHKHYEKIAIEDRYKAFRDMYMYCNYGFDLFDKEVLSSVLELSNNRKAIQELKKKGVGNTLTIYRGMGDRSTPLEDSYSWTLSLGTARRFAHFFGEGKVYQAKVNLEDILDYVTERNEEEILVKNESIKELELIEEVEN